MIAELAAVALVGGILSLDHTAAWQTMISQPLVACPLIGFIVGDPYSGLLVGALLQLVWLAEMPLGSSYYPDGTSGGIAGALLAAVGRGRFDLPELSVFSLAILLALAFSWIGAAVEVRWIRRLNGYLSDRMMRTEGGVRAGSLTRFTLLALAVVFAKGFVISALAYVSVMSILQWWRLPAGGPFPAGGPMLILTVAALTIAYFFHILINRRNWVGLIFGFSVGLVLLRLF